MKFQFSPSENHKSLISKIDPTHRFAGDQVKRWQNKLRKKLHELLGMQHFPEERCDLKPRELWSKKHRLGTIQKIVFRSEEGADVPAFVCLPKNAKPPYTFMICLQGHSTGMHVSLGVQRDNNNRKMEVQGDRNFAIRCMEEGIAALCIEQRSFGERRELVQERVSTHGCHDATMRALLLGRTLAGERVFDVDRGIDYLATRGDVDMDRIGVMGNSGGGTITIYSAALLPRVAFAMPSCSFCTYTDSIATIYHCADNYIPGILQYADMGDILGLFAPKPVVVVNGKEDAIFPIKAARKEFRHLQSIYDAAKAKDQCKLVVGPEGHRFYADAAWPVLQKLLKKI